jgi:hypothetical protein
VTSGWGKEGGGAEDLGFGRTAAGGGWREASDGRMTAGLGGMAEDFGF